MESNSARSAASSYSTSDVRYWWCGQSIDDEVRRCRPAASAFIGRHRTGDVVLLPADVAVTFTPKVHDALAASAAPDKPMLFDPAAAVIVPARNCR
jgi:hypothetical protein